MKKIFIVDDETYIRDELNYLLKQIDGYEVVGETGRSDEVLDLIKELEPDIVFLDIELRGANGLSIARLINNLEKSPEIIISTAYDKYAIMGFELNVADYILKPFSLERIIKALNKADMTRTIINDSISDNLKANISETKIQLDITDKIAVNVNGKILLINLEKVIYFTSSGNGSEVIADNKKYSTNLSLKNLENLISNKQFQRIHKSFIVNTDKIEEIIPWFNYTCKLKMAGTEEELLVSRSYYKLFKNRFLIS